MDGELEILTKVKEFRNSDMFDSLVAVVLFEPIKGEPEYDLEKIYYPLRYVPTADHHESAYLHIHMSLFESSGDMESFASENPGVTFEAEVIDFESGVPFFDLSPVENGSVAGRLWLHPSRLPMTINEAGDSCFLVIDVKYDHSVTVEQIGSEEAIEERRRNAKEYYPELEEMISE